MVKEIITEGKARIQVETAKIVSKDLEVFYNPDMVLNRDISIALLDTYFKKPISIALPLAGSGVRGIRIAKEIPHLIKILALNDVSKEATKLIKENFKRNDINVDQKSISVHEKDASLFLEESTGFDYIDIDPFGSPNQFLDTALRRLSRNGILAVTATDTSCLAGTYPTTCKRKYWSTSAISPLKHEVGLRILIRKVMLLGIHHSKALIPLFTYHHKHYYRVFFTCVKSNTKSAQLLDSLQSYINYDKTTANYDVSTTKDENKTWCGPLYNGSLQDIKFLEKLSKKFSHKSIDLAIQEIPLVGSYDTHQISQKNKIALVPIQELIEQLQEKKFLASRCPYNLHAIKTNASFQELLQLMKNISSKT